MECTLEMTRDEYCAITSQENVVVREYEAPDGTRVAKLVAWGDASECDDWAATPGLFVVPVGYSIVCQRSIPVKELLQPELAGKGET